jgi:hypothetical protein
LQTSGTTIGAATSQKPENDHPGEFMPFTNHPDNKPFPADLSEGFSLWSVIVTISEAQQKMREGHELVIDSMLGKLKGDNVPALVAKQWELIEKSQEIIADCEKILENHRDEIAALSVKP